MRPKCRFVSVLLIITVAFAPLAVADAIVPRDPAEFLVSPGTSSDLLRAAGVAVAPNGDFALVWSESFTSYDNPATIRVRRYLADGTPRDPSALLASANTAIYRGYPSVAIGSDGSMVVIWEEGFVWQPDVYMRRF